MSESETRRPAAGPSEERSELARVKRERDAAQVVFQQEAALREATQKLLTTAQRERDEARAHVDAEWRAAVEALTLTKYGIRSYCGERGDSCGKLRKLMDRAGPLPESVVTPALDLQEQPK